MDSSIDLERFAYDVFRINWIKGNVPRKDIPFFQHIENTYPPEFIRSIARYVRFYQLLMRKDIKKLVEGMNIGNVFEESNMFGFICYFTTCNKCHSTIHAMQNVACSLAVCSELSLYNYPMHSRLLGLAPFRWKTYFERFLQRDFFQHGGFECLHKHAKLMQLIRYILDINRYASNERFRASASAKTRKNIQSSINSFLDYCRSIDSSMLFEVVHRFVTQPVIVKWVKWAKKRIGTFVSLSLRRRYSVTLNETGESHMTEESKRTTRKVIEELFPK